MGMGFAPGPRGGGLAAGAECDRGVYFASTAGSAMHQGGWKPMRLDPVEIGQTMSEIVAYGTAVVLGKANG